MIKTTNPTFDEYRLTAMEAEHADKRERAVHWFRKALKIAPNQIWVDYCQARIRELERAG